MTPDTEQIIERLRDSDYRDDAIDDAIAALRACQWRPIKEAPKDDRMAVICGLKDGSVMALMNIDGVWTDGEFTYEPEYCFKVPPLPTPRASVDKARIDLPGMSENLFITPRASKEA